MWLHRVDIATALGKRLVLERAVDGRIVEDVVREWADRHELPFDLTLTGSLASRYVRPGPGPVLQIDPVELCWILSGRGEPDTSMPRAELLTRRVMF